MQILVTGGTGYIGSHTCVELLNNNYEVIIVDNLSNSKKEVVNKIEKITNKKLKFYELDIRNKDSLERVFKENKIDAVIHFAGLKAVGESVVKPLLYYNHNISSTLTLLEVMNEFNCKNIIFSSSATVYGEQESFKYNEIMECKPPKNPYGATKSIIERILKDLYISDNSWSISILRYFNPIGAHESGLIGEDPNDIPNNLMPYILGVAQNKFPELTIFGNDYNTIDGTCIRDYIHVVDLAKGHISALNHILKNPKGVFIYNLGTGHGTSVLELITTFERVNNLKLNYKFGARREGDLPACYADVTKSWKELGWKSEKTIEDMCKDSYNFTLKQK